MSNGQFWLFFALVMFAAFVQIAGAPILTYLMERRKRRRQFEVIATLNKPDDLMAMRVKLGFFCVLDAYRGNVWYWIQCLFGHNPISTDQRVKMVKEMLDNWKHSYGVPDETLRFWVKEWTAMQSILMEDEVYGWGLRDEMLEAIPSGWEDSDARQV